MFLKGTVSVSIEKCSVQRQQHFGYYNCVNCIGSKSEISLTADRWSYDLVSHLAMGVSACATNDAP